MGFLVYSLRVEEPPATPEDLLSATRPTDADSVQPTDVLMGYARACRTSESARVTTQPHAQGDRDPASQGISSVLPWSLPGEPSDR
jgi:hypothetical protein